MKIWYLSRFISFNYNGCWISNYAVNIKYKILRKNVTRDSSYINCHNKLDDFRMKNTVQKLKDKILSLQICFTWFYNFIFNVWFFYQTWYLYIWEITLLVLLAINTTGFVSMIMHQGSVALPVALLVKLLGYLFILTEGANIHYKFSY